MITNILIVVVVVLVVAAIAWFATRGSNQLPPGDAPDKLPPGDKKPDAAKPAATTKPAEPKKSEPPKAEPKKSEPPKAETPAAEPEKRPSVTPKSEPATAHESTAEKAPEPTSEVGTPALEAPPVAEPVAPVAEVVAEPVAPTKPAKPAREKRDVSALKKGLDQTRSGWMQRLFDVFRGKKELDPALLEQIEETLLTGDVGASVTRKLMDTLKQRSERHELGDAETVWELLKDDAREILDVGAAPLTDRPAEGPLVLLMVGVNGAGKTTTIAKLAGRYKEAGRTVLLAAGDTFRAAAVQQLEMWGRRVGVPVHKGKETAKPSSVVFEAVQRAVQEKIEVVIADTAGRLQNKAPLMEELRKIRDACAKASPGAPHEILLVLDATTGQNAISQAREFREVLGVTGIVLTKLDGTAKGGVILAVAEEFKLPVRFIGVGEKSDDLRPFDAEDFVEALFAHGEEA